MLLRRCYTAFNPGRRRKESAITRATRFPGEEETIPECFRRRRATACVVAKSKTQGIQRVSLRTCATWFIYRRSPSVGHSRHRAPLCSKQGEPKRSAVRGCPRGNSGRSSLENVLDQGDRARGCPGGNPGRPSPELFFWPPSSPQPLGCREDGLPAS